MLYSGDMAVVVLLELATGVAIWGRGFLSFAFRTKVARSGDEAVPGERKRDLLLLTDFACSAAISATRQLHPTKPYHPARYLAP